MRLIDADALIKTLETYKFGAIQNEVERAYIKETVINFVKDAPTAYDPEAVVAELEELSNAEADYYYAKSNDVIDRETAIEIVRKGGV